MRVSIEVPGGGTFQVEYTKGQVPYVGKDGQPCSLDTAAAAAQDVIKAQWERFPVQLGECWRVGNALFLCGDIVDTQVAQQLTDMLGTERFIAYSYPPMADDAITTFRRNLDLPKCDFEDVVIAWTNLVMDADAIFIEGTPTLASTENIYRMMLAVCGHTVQQAVPIVYHTVSHLLIQLSPVGEIPEQPVPTIPDIQGAIREEMLNKLFGKYEPTLVFDPFMNWGAAAQCAVQNGHRFIGCEAHPRRMAFVLGHLASRTDTTPERLYAI